MNKCEDLIKQWRLKDAEIRSAQMIDVRDIEVLEEIEKKLKDQCWRELDANMMSRIDRERWFKELHEGKNPRIHGRM